jgi:hypothetical protein
MVGEARLTAHGSGGAVLPGGAAAPDDGPGGGAVIESGELGVVACGVFATVESPEPQPLNVAATKATAARPGSSSVGLGSDHTPRTVPSSGSPVWQACRAVDDRGRTAAPDATGLAFATKLHGR